MFTCVRCTSQPSDYYQQNQITCLKKGNRGSEEGKWRPARLYVYRGIQRMLAKMSRSALEAWLCLFLNAFFFGKAPCPSLIWPGLVFSKRDLLARVERQGGWCVWPSSPQCRREGRGAYLVAPTRGPPAPYVANSIPSCGLSHCIQHEPPWVCPALNDFYCYPFT